MPRILNKKFPTALAAAALLSLLALPAWGKNLQTKYFSLDLPDGWEWNEPDMAGNDAWTIVLDNKNKETLIVIGVMQSSLPAERIAAQSAAALAKDSSAQISQPVEKDGTCAFSYTMDDIKGISRIRSNGKEFSVISITGDVGIGEKLLRTLKPEDKKLFPIF